MMNKKVWFITGAGRGMGAESPGRLCLPATPWWPRADTATQCPRPWDRRPTC